MPVGFISEIAKLISALGILKPNQEARKMRQQRKNLRFLERKIKRLRRKMDRHGSTQEEEKAFNDLRLVYIQKLKEIN